MLNFTLVDRVDRVHPPETSASRASATPLHRQRALAGSHAPLAPIALYAVAALLGIGAGIGAFVFRTLIAGCHDLLFSGRLSLQYDTNQYTARSPLGVFVALVPVAGSVIVTFLVQTFAPEAKGHGVPEVMDAIHYQKSKIRPSIAVIKSLASALSIGSGGSVGREGPIIQIGAALGSLSARLANVSRWQRATLVAAGGGAGIAATFNTPIGGVLFAVEVLLYEVSARTLVPVALSTTSATYIARWLLGDRPAFPVPALHLTQASSVWLLPASALLGVLGALLSALFIRALYRTEDFFDATFPRRPYLRHAVGMFGVGVTFTMLMAARGHYYVEGVGYATIMDILSNTLTDVRLLVLLLLLKLAVTCVTLGSGASGGVFSPSLFLGATCGGAIGVAMHALVPGLEIPPAAFALVGMAAVVAGATGAALTAIVMLFEMTLDYAVIVPLTVAAAISYGVRRMLLSESIYTLKLARRGHLMPQALQANTHMVHRIADIATASAPLLAADAPPRALRAAEGPDAPSHFVIVASGRVIGVIARSFAVAHPERLQQARTVGELAQDDFLLVAPEMKVFNLMAALQRSHKSVAIVAASHAELADASSHEVPKTCAVVTKELLAEALAQGLELFAD